MCPVSYLYKMYQKCIIYNRNGMNTHLLTLCILPFVMLYTQCILLHRTGNTYTMYIYFNEFKFFYFYSNIYKETRMDRTQQYNITVPAIVVQVSSNNLHSFIQSVMDTYFEQMINQHCTIGVISHCAVDGIWAELSNSITESESFSILCTALYFL